EPAFFGDQAVIGPQPEVTFDATGLNRYGLLSGLDSGAEQLDLLSIRRMPAPVIVELRKAPPGFVVPGIRGHGVAQQGDTLAYIGQVLPTQVVIVGLASLDGDRSPTRRPVRRGAERRRSSMKATQHAREKERIRYSPT